MRLEKRSEEKRVELYKPVELIDPEVGFGWAGYMKNFSPSGMRARLDTAPSPGDCLRLAISLADGTSPLLTTGKIVWCAPDARGGAEVGVRFIGEP